jgi:hypothetical protein
MDAMSAWAWGFGWQGGETGSVSKGDDAAAKGPEAFTARFELEPACELPSARAATIAAESSIGVA